MSANNDTPEQRSRTMRAVKGQDTSPEKTVRRLIHHMGYRYRLHRRDLPGKPDLVFASRRKVVFVHGCFWHGHGCKRGARMPKTNVDYWRRKIGRNVERDAEHHANLRALGWDVMIVWECELKDTAALAERIKAFLSGCADDG